MKNLFTKTSAIVLVIASLSVTLVGCGSGADSESMRKVSAPSGMSMK